MNYDYFVMIRFIIIRIQPNSCIFFFFFLIQSTSQEVEFNFQCAFVISYTDDIKHLSVAMKWCGRTCRERFPGDSKQNGNEKKSPCAECTANAMTTNSNQWGSLTVVWQICDMDMLANLFKLHRHNHCNTFKNEIINLIILRSQASPSVFYSSRQ